MRILLGSIAVTAIIAGLSGAVVGSRLKQAEWNATVLGQKAGEDAALRAAAEAIAKIEVKSEKFIQPIRTEIRTNTVYRDCGHSPDSLRNLNALIEGTEPSGDVIVPSADKAE